MTGAFLPGKPIKGESESLRVVVLRYLFVLLCGLVFGFVLQSASVLVKAVDSFGKSDSSVAFSGYSQ